MSDFSDKEDKMLVQLAIQQELNGIKRISWIEISKKMRSKKRPDQLRLRLACLKKRFGKELLKFPVRYHGDINFSTPIKLKKVQQPEVCMSPIQRRLETSLMSLFDGSSDSETECNLVKKNFNFPAFSSPLASIDSKRLQKRSKKILLETGSVLAVNGGTINGRTDDGASRLIEAYRIVETSPLSQTETYAAVEEVFQVLEKNDVRHQTEHQY
jgi:hypothetical protein